MSPSTLTRATLCQVFAEPAVNTLPHRRSKAKLPGGFMPQRERKIAVRYLMIFVVSNIGDLSRPSILEDIILEL
jgi:hypothetical protein